MRSLFAVLTLLLALTTPVLAQASAKATLTGTITDQTAIACLELASPHSNGDRHLVKQSAMTTGFTSDGSCRQGNTKCGLKGFATRLSNVALRWAKQSR